LRFRFGQFVADFRDKFLVFAKELFVFQADGEEDGLQGPWSGGAASSPDVQFGPVEKAIERFLIFFAQGAPELLPFGIFPFQNLTEG
jgi:hypothetical protein